MSIPRNDIPNWLTHPCLHLRDAKDARILLEAVRRGILPLIKRRIIFNENRKLTSGSVFVWEEDEEEGGLLRWTDGRRWSQSRMRGDYLYYEEKVEITPEEKELKAARRAHRTSNPNVALPPPTRRKDRPSKIDGLTKQTYSAIVQLPGTPRIRRWHVVAYFETGTNKQLPVIDHYHYLRDINVPRGVFQSAKAVGPIPDSYLYNLPDRAESSSASSYPPSPNERIAPSPPSGYTPSLGYPSPRSTSAYPYTGVPSHVAPPLSLHYPSIMRHPDRTLAHPVRSDIQYSPEDLGALEKLRVDLK